MLETLLTDQPETKAFKAVKTRDWKKETEVHISMKLPPIKPSILINDAWACTEGGILLVAGQKKAGKSITLLNAISTAFMTKVDVTKTLGIRSLPTEKDVIYIDTEQSKNRTYSFIERVIRTAGLKHQPSNLKFHNIREIPTGERIEFLRDYVFANAENIGILILDGVVDFMKSMNNEEEARELTDLIWKYLPATASLVCVIHSGRGGSDAMGHVGQMLEKKCSGTIHLSKDRKTGTHCIKCNMIRDGGDFDDILFRWDDKEKGFVLLSDTDLKALAEKTEAEKLEQLKELVRKCFLTDTYQLKKDLTDKVLTHDNTIDKSVKLDSQKRAARRRIKEMEDNELIKLDNETKKYSKK